MEEMTFALPGREHRADVLAVCDEDNYASEKVILKNGGVLENRLFDRDEGVYVKRYWLASGRTLV